MEPYIQGNKEAWEEAFDNRKASYGENLAERVSKGDYAYFEAEMIPLLKSAELAGKTIGQFCCNNGRELLSLVKSSNAKAGFGFDLAENMVRFANEKARELNLPCTFVAANVLDLGEQYREKFDFVLLTIGALCWFQDLDAFFRVVAGSLKRGGKILINEQHPITNMFASDEDAEFDPAHPAALVFSYFEHEWIGNDGMAYIAGRNYPSKTFTDYTHALSEIVGAMCKNGLVITGMQEFDYDISENFDLDRRGLPLSIILEGRKD